MRPLERARVSCAALAGLVLTCAGGAVAETPGPAPAPAAAAPAAGPQPHPATAGRAGVAAPQNRLRAMRSMSEFFPSRSIPRRGFVHHFGFAPTPGAELRYEFEGRRYDALDFAERNHVTALVVVHRGVLVYQDFRQGTTDATPLTSYSMAKSIVGLLAGFAVGDGAIESVDDPVTRYVPELRGTAYDGPSVKHLLQMSSGVAFDEGYTNPASDIFRFSYASLISNQAPALAFVKTLPRAHAPGTVFNYSSAETQVLGQVVANAVGQSLSGYLHEKLWSVLGMEHDATWLLDRNGGTEFCSIGLNAAARDYARVGQLMLQGGVWDGVQLLPEGWVEASTTPDGPQVGYGRIYPTQPDLGYGYQWWPYRDGSFDAEGVFGQFIWVSPQHQTVIVKTSAWPSGTSDALKAEALAAFRAFSSHFAAREAR